MILFALIAILFVFSTASAEKLNAIPMFSGEFDLYGFGSLNGPSKADSLYSWDWVRFGFKARPHGDFIEGYLVRFEYDITGGGLKYAYVEKEFDNGFSAQGGTILSAAMYAYSGPSGLRLPRWPDAQGGGLSVYTTGLSLWYTTEEDYVFRFTHYGEEKYVASATVGPLTAYWENKIGYGAVIEHSFNEWVNPFVGVTNYDGRISENPTNVFAQNYFQLGEYWRLYVQYDWNELEEDDWLVGFTAEYAKDSFVKFYYDERNNFFTGELTYSF